MKTDLRLVTNTWLFVKPQLISKREFRLPRELYIDSEPNVAIINGMQDGIVGDWDWGNPVGIWGLFL